MAIQQTLDNVLEKSGEIASNLTSKDNSLPLRDLSYDKYGPDYVNVTQTLYWTLAPKYTRTSVPSLQLIQYELDANALMTNLLYWGKSIFEGGSDIYKNLYFAQPTGVEFWLPWFEDYHHNITQNWEDFKGLETTQVGEKIIKGLQLLTNTPGVAINTPKIWKGAARATIPYNITLFNTVGEDTSKAVTDNRRFINRLIMSSLHDQQNAVLATPPAIYKMIIPGVRYSEACTLSNLQISNLGVLTQDQNSGDVIPEAWRVSFQINELISESRQMFNKINPPELSKITSVITSSGPAVIGEPDLAAYSASRVALLDD